MEITWYGQSCFRLVERNQATIVTDPFSEAIGLPTPKVKADIVTVSHEGLGHSAVDTIKGTSHVLYGAGEYEIGGTFITGIAMPHVENDLVRPNVAFLFEYATGVSVLHLGDLSHVPSQSTIEAMGDVTVLLVPVGGGNGLKAAMAAEVIGLIEPTYIIPMHYALPNLTIDLESVDKFLKAMGVSKVQEEETLRVTASGLPEQPQVVLLTPPTK